jgi:hypothetical protein
MTGGTPGPRRLLTGSSWASHAGLNPSKDFTRPHNQLRFRNDVLAAPFALRAGCFPGTAKHRLAASPCVTLQLPGRGLAYVGDSTITYLQL